MSKLPSCRSSAKEWASGQEEVGDLSRRDDVDRLRHVEHRPVVAVADHAALGRAGRARRVDEGADVVGRHGPVARLPLAALMAGAAAAELVEVDRVARGPLHDHDLLELREPVADRADLRELLLVLDDDQPRVGVLEHVLAFLGRVRLVDRDDGGAGAERREVDVGPLRPRVREDRDLVALLDPEVDQPERQLGDGLADLRVGAAGPLARRLLPHDRGSVPVALGREREEVGDCAAAGALSGSGLGQGG